MNAVELDVGNLNQWLINTASGKKVNYLNQNGYLLYFSDQRGMVQDPNAANLTYGEYGFEDVSTLARSPVLRTERLKARLTVYLRKTRTRMGSWTLGVARM
jgi:hypothetical protein